MRYVSTGTDRTARTLSLFLILGAVAIAVLS